MTSSGPSDDPPARGRRPRMRAETAYALLLVLIFAGFAFAAYATYETFNPAAQQACSISPYLSCSKVDNSGHTSTLGVPDWAIGVAGYLVLIVLGLLVAHTWKREYLKLLTAVSLLGALVSLYLAYVELVIIQGLCPVCLSTYLCNAGVLAMCVYLLRLTAGREDEVSETGAIPAPSDPA